MHLWVLPLEQGEMDAMRLTAAGFREMMHEESRSLASILTNMHRTGRTTYADLLMAALLQQTRVSAMLEERSEQQRKQRLREEQVRFFHQVKPGEGSVPSQVKRDPEPTSPPPAVRPVEAPAPGADSGGAPEQATPVPISEPLPAATPLDDHQDHDHVH